MSSRHLVRKELLGGLEYFPGGDWTHEQVLALRATPRPRPPMPDVPEVEFAARLVPGPRGAPDVRVIVFRPKAAAGPLPAILHIHGGGYVMGTADMTEPAAKMLSRDLGCVIVSVDYRLAPETSHPGPVEDCYAALHWLHAHAAELGVDPARIALKGESAGGGLAAALALLARDRGEVPLCYQLLVYPMIDDRAPAEPHPFTGEFVWTHGSNRFGWASLLGHEPGAPGVSHYAAASRAEELAGLPPTYIAVGALDLFLEEDLEYARRLTRAGVPVELHVYPGAYHGFEAAGDTHTARQAQRNIVEALKDAFAAAEA